MTRCLLVVEVDAQHILRIGTKSIMKKLDFGAMPASTANLVLKLTKKNKFEIKKT